MNLSQTPRRKKMLYSGLGALALALVVTTVVTVQRNQIKADVASTGVTTDNLTRTLDLLVKVVDEKGNAVPAFLDANVDANSDCVVDVSEEGTGVLGDTQDDGTGTLALDYAANYTITATAKSDERKGTLGVATGATVATGCAKAVPSNNKEPLTITVR